MTEVERARLKVALSRHYAQQRGGADAEALDALVCAMVAEDARVRRWGMADGRPAVRQRSLAAFVAAQVRFIPAWTWAVQVMLVALMAAVAALAGDAHGAKLAVGMLSAATVLVGVPTLASSKQYGVAELEYACPNNVASVLVARLIVLGCSSALAVAIMVATVAASADAGVFEVALWAAPPFFFSCAGALMALRLAPPSAASAICVVWTLFCCGALAAFALSLPEMYADASLAVWAGAAAVAGVWLAHEVVCTFQAAVQGLDAFSPHAAETHN